MRHTRHNVMIRPEDWEYLGRIAEVIGQTRAQMVRDTITQMTETLRNTIGDNPEKPTADLANIYRAILLETSKALEQVANTEPSKSRKRPGSARVAG